jgi:hypothetical protein
MLGIIGHMNVTSWRGRHQAESSRIMVVSLCFARSLHYLRLDAPWASFDFWDWQRVASHKPAMGIRTFIRQNDDTLKNQE